MKVTIHGVEVEMEERICAGGCGTSFRCLKTSKTLLARAYCQYYCKGLTRTVEERNLQHAQFTQTAANSYTVLPRQFRKKNVTESHIESHEPQNQSQPPQTPNKS